MATQLNHTIVWSSDPGASATFLAGLLDLSSRRLGHFPVVELDNGVALRFRCDPRASPSQHYGFLIAEAAFDDVFARNRDLGLAHWADPFRTQAGRINREDGGRGIYLVDADSHNLEVITRPYGASGA